MRRLIISGVVTIAISLVAIADAVTITVPPGVDATVDEAIAASYMSGATDYAGLLAASDLVVNGAGRLIIDKDLKTAGFAGEVHVRSGSRLQLRVSGALGDTAHGTFVEDGATLETWTDGAADTLNFLGEPLSFAGTGVDGEGALVSLTTKNQQRKGAWGGTILTMTGDALVHVKNARTNLNFPYQSAHASNSLDMNGHTLTFCGPYSSGSSACTLPLRLNITNPGHIVVSNGLYVSINNDNVFGGNADNTFAIADSISRLDLYQSTRSDAKPWSLILKPGVRRDVLLSTAGGGRWDGPIIWQDSSVPSPIFQVKATENGGDVTFAGPVTTGIGLEITNTTVGAAYSPTFSLEGKGNVINGNFKVSDVETTFLESNPSLDGIEIVNTKLVVNRLGIAGLWKGTNQAYLGWSKSGDERYLKQHWVNTSAPNTGDDYIVYTNSVAYGPDDVMSATAASYGKNTYVTYCGYIWNTNSSARTITFFMNTDVTKTHIGVRVKNALAGNWAGGRETTDDAYKLAGVRLDPGPHPIEIRIALVNGVGAVNTTYSGDYGLMYCWGDEPSTSTIASDYEPLMDPGDGSLFTRYAPGTDGYEALGIFDNEPFTLANCLAGCGGAILALNGGNYAVGSVTGVLSVVNEEIPHAENVAFTVKDELCCAAADLLAGEHLVVTGPLKFAQGSLLTIPAIRAMPSTGAYVVAEATGGITGLPTFDQGQSRRKVTMRVVDGTKLVADISPSSGFILSFR